jgi:hypothetical protein
MSELEPEMLRRTLLLEQSVTRQLDGLVRRANTTAALLKSNDRMEESQLRNVLNVAIESRSIEVVVNFIRYQIARNGSAWGTNSGSFGHTVIADLRGEVKQRADAALAFVRERAGATPEVDALADEAYVRLMQLYLGYLQRAFYYGKKTGDFDTLKETANVT